MPCYADTDRELGRLIDDEMRAAGLTISPDARAALIPLLGGDRRASRNELRKLATYAAGNGSVDLDAVLAVVADASALALDEVIDAAFAGQAKDLDLHFKKAIAAGTTPSSIIFAALRQLGNLHKARLSIEDGGNVTQQLGSDAGAFQPQDRGRERAEGVDGGAAGTLDAGACGRATADARGPRARRCGDAARADRPRNRGAAQRVSAVDPSTKPLIALTGATGFIGRHLLRELPARGFRMRVLLRRPTTMPVECASAVVGDLARPINMAAALADVDAVIHSAGLAHAMSGAPADDYRVLNTDATIALARAAQRAGVRRFVFLSSVRAQSGPTAAEILTEDRPRSRPTLTANRSSPPSRAWRHSTSTGSRCGRRSSMVRA